MVGIKPRGKRPSTIFHCPSPSHFCSIFFRHHRKSQMLYMQTRTVLVLYWRIIREAFCTGKRLINSDSLDNYTIYTIYTMAGPRCLIQSSSGFVHFIEMDYTVLMQQFSLVASALYIHCRVGDGRASVVGFDGDLNGFSACSQKYHHELRL